MGEFLGNSCRRGSLACQRLANYSVAVTSAGSEERGTVDLSACGDKPRIGVRFAVISNHVCPVSSLFDVVNFTEGSHVIESIEIAARGRVQSSLRTPP